MKIISTEDLGTYSAPAGVWELFNYDRPPNPPAVKMPEDAVEFLYTNFSEFSIEKNLNGAKFEFVQYKKEGANYVIVFVELSASWAIRGILTGLKKMVVFIHGHEYVPITLEDMIKFLESKSGSNLIYGYGLIMNQSLDDIPF